MILYSECDTGRSLRDSSSERAQRHARETLNRQGISKARRSNEHDRKRPHSSARRATDLYARLESHARYGGAEIP